MWMYLVLGSFTILLEKGVSRKPFMVQFFATIFKVFSVIVWDRVLLQAQDLTCYT